MVKFQKITIILFFFLHHLGFGQKDYIIDSLQQQLNDSISVYMRIDLLNEIAWQWLTNDPNKSEQYLNNALSLSKKNNYQKGIGTYYHYKGLLSYYSGNINEALDYFFTSFHTRKNAGDEKGLAAAARVIGVMFANQSLYDKSEEYYQMSLKICQRIKDTIGMASILNNLGVIYEDQKKYDKALFQFTKALKLVENSNDAPSIGLYTNNIANILHQQKKDKKAEKYYFKSLKFKKIAGDYVYLTTIYTDIANYYIDIGKPAKAINYLNKSWELASKSKLIHELATASESYSKAYELIGDTETALLYYKQFKTYNDNIKNEQIASKLTQLDMSLQFEKEKEISQLRQEKKDLENQKEINRQRSYILIIFIVLISTVVIAIVTYRNFNLKKKDNIILKRQKSEIVQQRDQISKHRKMLIDSINYARRIQQALLPSEKTFNKYFSNSFIYYLPKDIISGDFYWIKQMKNVLYFAVADCTGHGVPGALMSMLGISFLNEIVTKNNVSGPASILEDLRKQVKMILQQNDSVYDSGDGLDIALCQLNLDTYELKYSGANTPMYLLHDNDFIQFEPVENPIGNYIQEIEFEDLYYQLEKLDILYLFSDGFIDQVNGITHKKLLTHNFQKMIFHTHVGSFDNQKDEIATYYNKWKGRARQVDDITILGLQV